MQQADYRFTLTLLHIQYMKSLKYKNRFSIRDLYIQMDHNFNMGRGGGLCPL